MKKIVLAIDLGGHNRIIALDLQGNIVAKWSCSAAYTPAPEYICGIDFDAGGLKEVLFAAMAQIVKEVGDGEIVAITTASQREGIVLIDKKGAPIAAYPNADMRGVEFVKTFNWPAIQQETALAPLPLYSAQKLFALFRKHPERKEAAMAVTSISGWMGYLLTGKLYWERSQAIHSALYNIFTQSWSETLCGIFDVPLGLLPQIREAGEIVGYLKDDVAEALGLKPGIPLVAGGADTQAALAGVMAREGDIVMVNGTTTPILAPIGELRPGAWWLSPGMLDVPFVLEDNTGSTGTSLDVLVNQMMEEPDRMGALEKAEARYKEGIMPPVTGVFSQNIFSAENYVTSGGFIMSNPIGAGITRQDYVYAMMLNIAFVLKEAVDIVSRNVDACGRLIGTGGGFAGDLEAQVIADLTGREVVVYNTSRQATVYGCLRACCRALAEPYPEPVVQRVYKPADRPDVQAYYENWKKCKAALLTLQKK